MPVLSAFESATLPGIRQQPCQIKTLTCGVIHECLINGSLIVMFRTTGLRQSAYAGLQSDRHNVAGVSVLMPVPDQVPSS